MSRSITCIGVKSNGKMKIFDREGFNATFAQFGEGEEFNITLEDVEIKKTRLQERGFHAMIQPWAKEEGHQIDDLKRDLLREIFGEREHMNPITGDVEMVLREPHTSTLSKTKYSELIERTLEIGARCGHVLVAPNEWRERKERERRKQAAA